MKFIIKKDSPLTVAKSYLYVVVALFLSVFSMQAHATVPAGVQASLDAILTDATAVSVLAAPVILGVLGLVVVFKIIKRFVSKI